MVRPLGLRRRDRNVFAIVVVVWLCNVCTSVLYWRATSVRVARIRADLQEQVQELRAGADAANARADAFAAALASRPRTGDAPSASHLLEPQRRPQIVGVGRTKNHRGEVVPYVDVRDENGAVSRTYLPVRIGPSKQFRSAVPFRVSGSVGAERPEADVPENDSPPFHETPLVEPRFEENENGP